MSLTRAFVDLVKQEKKFIGIFLFYTLCVSVLLHFYPLQGIIQQVERLGRFSAIAFVFLYIVRGFLYFPTLYFLVAAGILFAPWPGFGIYMSAILLSATLSYTIGKALHDSDRFPRFKKRIQEPEIEQKIHERGLTGVFLLHVTGISLDIPNYLSGYVGLSFVRFIGTVLVANLITAGAYYLFFMNLIAPFV